MRILDERAVHRAGVVKELAGSAIVDDAVAPGKHEQQWHVQIRRRLPCVTGEQAILAGKSPRDLAERQRILSDELTRFVAIGKQERVTQRDG